MSESVHGALTFAELATTNRARCEAPDGFNHQLQSWSLAEWFLGVTGELGEAANVAKKLNRVRDGLPGNKETPAELREKLRGEVADALIYLDLLAQAAGFSLADAVVSAFNRKSEEIGAPHRLDGCTPVGNGTRTEVFFAADVDSGRLRNFTRNPDVRDLWAQSEGVRILRLVELRAGEVIVPRGQA